jgi:hypothetical protein
MAAKSRSAKKPRGSTTKGTQINAKAKENTLPSTDLNVEDDPTDEVMQSTRWSADEKTAFFEALLGADSDDIFNLLKVAPKAAFEKVSSIFTRRCSLINLSRCQ